MSTAAGLDALSLARALAAIRIFFGLILFSNGLAKLLSFTRGRASAPTRRRSSIAPRHASILEFEVNQRGGDGTDLPLLKSIVNDVMLDNWGLFQWVTTAVELGAGLALILGHRQPRRRARRARPAAVPQLVYFSSGRFMWEQPHEWVPLVILALVPTGRVWGLDAPPGPPRDEEVRPLAVLDAAPPLGSRLWLYTNFDCNLACDYCCARSSPRAAARRLPLDVARRACEEFAGLGGREILLTGGEPFLDPELPRSSTRPPAGRP